MNTIVTKGLALIMVLMMAPMAWASSNPGHLTLEDLDADKNGYISKEEASSSESVAKLFDEADVNKDNQLDMSEFVVIASRLKK